MDGGAAVEAEVAAGVEVGVEDELSGGAAESWECCDQKNGPSGDQEDREDRGSRRH